MLLAAAFTLALWRADALIEIYAIMIGLAFCAEMHRPATGALIADLLPAERRVTAFTLYRLAVNVGWAAGLALGGFLAVHAFSLLFIGDTVSSATFGLLALVALPHGVRTSRAEEGPSALLELPLTAWSQHRSRTSVIALGDLLIGGGFCALVAASSVPALTVVIVVWTLGEMLESPIASAFVADRAPEHARGRYTAAYGSMFGVAWILGPMLGTGMYALTPDLVWIGCGALGMCAAGLAVAAGRRRAPAAASALETPVAVS